MTKRKVCEDGKMAKIAIVMGSTSDWPTMQNAAVMLKQFGVEFEGFMQINYSLENIIIQHRHQQ